MQSSPKEASSTWNKAVPETEEVYARLQVMAREGEWSELKHGDVSNPSLRKYFFTRVATENGPVIQHAVFLNRRDKKLRGVCQFGLEAQGPNLGFVHGGASAAVHDVICGMLTMSGLKLRAATAQLTVNFKNPVPLRSAVLMDASIDKMEGKKIFLTSRLKSPNGAILYTESSALFVITDTNDRIATRKPKAAL